MQNYCLTHTLIFLAGIERRNKLLHEKIELPHLFQENASTKNSRRLILMKVQILKVVVLVLISRAPSRRSDDCIFSSISSYTQQTWNICALRFSVRFFFVTFPILR